VLIANCWFIIDSHSSQRGEGWTTRPEKATTTLRRYVWTSPQLEANILKTFMKKQIALHSGLTPSVVADALRRSMDEERRTLFSLSGYKGDQAVLGVVMGNTFRLQKRRYWHNDFAPHFYGQILPEPGGTRIEGHFDLGEWVKVFMRVWLAGAVLLGSPIFIMMLFKALNGTLTGDDRVGLIVPPALIIWGFVLPKLGRLLGRSDETFILEHLENVLYAHVDPTPS
jgi:hypothetical protein